MLTRIVRDYGYETSVCSIRTIELTGGQIAADPDGAISILEAECVRAIEEDEADVVILGGAGLVGLAERIAPHLKIPLIDSVIAGAQVALSLASKYSENDSVI
jgi:allantoin racemase